MKDCQKTRKNLAAFLGGELEEGERARVSAHLEACSPCRAELSKVLELVESAESIRDDLDKAMASVDWDDLAESIADRAMEETVPARASLVERFRNLIVQPRWRPVYAGLVTGIIIGSVLTFLVFRSLRSPLPGASQFRVSPDFLDRLEMEMARRETIDYLERSQYLLLDFVQSTPEQAAGWPRGFAAQRAKNLLERKKYINPQLDRFRMAKAKAICDQIELLFYELTQVSDSLSADDLERIQVLIDDKQLLLKINLVKKDLKENEI